MDLETIKVMFVCEELYPKFVDREITMQTSNGLFKARSWPVAHAQYSDLHNNTTVMDLNFPNVLDWLLPPDNNECKIAYYSLIDDLRNIETLYYEDNISKLPIQKDSSVCSALTNFIFCVPAEVRKAINMLAEKRWLVLNLASRIPEYKDLLLSSPALALYLALKVKEVRAVRTISRLNQKKILGLLGFLKLPSIIRIISKIKSDSTCFKTIENLRQATGNKAVRKLLGHIKTINSSVVEAAVIMSRNWEFINLTPSLLLELSLLEGTDDAATHKILGDICQFAEQYSQKATSFFHIQSLNKLWSFHKWMEIYKSKHADDYYTFSESSLPEKTNTQPINNNSGIVTPFQIDSPDKLWHYGESMEIYDSDDEYGDFPFPEPPLPGNDCIIPITSCEEMANEALVQNNCLASYNKEVVSGDAYFYRVLTPERATLSLYQEDNRWVLGELLGCSNIEMSKNSWLMVKSWLKDFCFKEKTRDRAQQILGNESQLSFRLFSMNK